MAATSRKIVLLAPVSGTAVPLSDVPDPVFAQKMVGDGMAIMPSGNTLRAPCDGTVSQLHSACHALTLTTPEGLQVLMHVGIESVRLQGKGFESRVAVGELVKAGAVLLVFDLEYITRMARSPLCLMVLSNGEMAEHREPASGELIGGSSPALTVTLRDRQAGELFGPENLTAESNSILVPNPMGLHARPAAMLAAAAKRFRSDLLLLKDGKGANVKSVMSIMGLDVQFHDRVHVRAAGPDAPEAVEALTALVEKGLGEDLRPASPVARAQPCRNGTNDSDNSCRGIPVSPGLAVGTVWHLRRQALQARTTGGAPEDEQRSLSLALTKAREELAALEKRMRDRGDAGKAAIFGVQREILEDPELLGGARTRLAQGQSASQAWQGAYIAQAAILAGMQNSLLSNRAIDVRDTGDRVLRILTGQAGPRLDTPENAVLICEELAPSEMAALDAGRVRGICTTRGSSTSHTSLLARSMNIPSIAAIDPGVLEIPDGTTVVVDGDNGVLSLNPDATELGRIRTLLREAGKKRALEERDAAEPAVTVDGHRIHIGGNISGVDDAAQVVRLGGEGVGLLRSEFLFLKRAEAPTEEEQTDAYCAVAATLGPERDLVVRTLDVGGDKPLAYFPLPRENNPFLGIRGIRLNLLDTGLFIGQVRAVLRAASFTRLHIMFPMVSGVEEVREAKAVVEREKAALGITDPVRIGIMVEVPSAALLAEHLASEVDFFSIGSNDLAQYVLAMDRDHARLAELADALHPAVLRLIAETVRGAHALGKRVALCGNLADDPEALPVLLGLGLDALSVSPSSIPAVKGRIRRLNMEVCATLAADALSMLTAKDVRRYVKLFSEDAAALCPPSC